MSWWHGINDLEDLFLVLVVVACLGRLAWAVLDTVATKIIGE